MGEIFWTEAFASSSARQSTRANCTCDIWPRKRKSGRSSAAEHRCCNTQQEDDQQYLRGNEKRNESCNRGKSGYARAHDCSRERSISGGVLESWRGGQELAAQEIHGRCQASAHSRPGAPRCRAANRRMAVRHSLKRRAAGGRGEWRAL